MPGRIRERLCRHRGDILGIDPADTRIRDELPDHAVRQRARAVVAQQVLHEVLRPQMGEGKTAPLDVALHELVPRPVRHRGLVVAAGTEVHDLPHARPVRLVEEGLALAQHVDRVAGHEECALHAFERGCERLLAVEIQHHALDALALERRRPGARPDGRDDPQGGVVLEQSQGASTDEAGRAEDEDRWLPGAHACSLVSCRYVLPIGRLDHYRHWRIRPIDKWSYRQGLRQAQATGAGPPRPGLDACAFARHRADARAGIPGNDRAADGGRQRCLGNRLAELQLTVLWQEILRRKWRIDVVGPAVRKYASSLRGFSAMPVKIRA